MPDHSPIEKAFIRDYRRLFDRVFRYVSARERHSASAEDVVASAMEEAFKSLKKFDPEKGNLEGWVMTIAKRTLYRHWSKNFATVDIVDLTHALPANEIRSDRAVDAALAWERVADSMSDESFALLTMRFGDEMSFDEIAAALGKSSEAVRQSCSRLVRALRERFPDLQNHTYAND
jgi:RNA polymerase sigma factor (sigma-70 family)